MSETRTDAVDRALDVLAGEDTLELPDPRLSARLVRAANRSRGGSRGALGALRFRNLAAAAVALVLVTGITTGATVGFEGLRSWWYSIVVDGERTSGTVTGDGEREVEFTTDDGYQVSVRIERRELPGQVTATRVHVREVGHGQVEEEIHEVRARAGDEQPAGSEPERFERESLADCRLLHTWVDAAGTRSSLWMGPDPTGPGARLLLEDAGSRAARPVALVLRTARPIRGRGSVSIVESAAGQLEVQINDGRGWEVAVTLGDAGPPAPTEDSPPREFTTPSGRVNVKFGD